MTEGLDRVHAEMKRSSVGNAQGGESTRTLRWTDGSERRGEGSGMFRSTKPRRKTPVKRPLFTCHTDPPTVRGKRVHKRPVSFTSSESTE